MIEPHVHWLIPQLSLCMEAQQELDRRTAARMDRDQLHALADELIVSWHEHNAVLNQCLGRIRQLEVELALAGAPRWQETPSEEHLRMAQQLLQGRD